MKKPCTNCSEVKSLSEFYFDNKSNSGHCCWCKKCQTEGEAKRYRFKNRANYIKRLHAMDLRIKDQIDKYNKLKHIVAEIQAY